MTDVLQQSDDLAASVAVAPRVTLKALEAKIAKVEYLRAGPGGLLTICVLTMVNGFTVTGEAATASPENFDEAVGQEFAYQDAVRAVWAFEGYLLRERLFEAISK